MKRVHIIDDFLECPSVDREIALLAEYKDTVHRGLNYPGISITEDPCSEDRIRSVLGVQKGTFTTFLRRYLPDEKQGTYIHNDCQIGFFSGILFLTEPSHCKGGVAFWRHRLYGWEAQPDARELAPKGLRDTAELWESVHQDGFDEFKWEMVDYVPVEFNRLILFLSARYHSRFPKNPEGSDLANCRLIKTFFWQPDAPLGDAPEVVGP